MTLTSAQTYHLRTAQAIYAAMMAANAHDTTAPQDGVYGALARALADTLAAFYATAPRPGGGHRVAALAAVAYAAVIASGEVSEDLLHDVVAVAAVAAAR